MTFSASCLSFGDELGSELAVLVDDVKILVPHLPLDRLDDAIRGLLRNPLERRADHHAFFIAEQHDRRGDRLTLGVNNRLGISLVVELCDRGKRGPQVDTDRVTFLERDRSHAVSLISRKANSTVGNASESFVKQTTPRKTRVHCGTVDGPIQAARMVN